MNITDLCYRVYAVCECGYQQQAPFDDIRHINSGVCPRCGGPRWKWEAKTIRWDTDLNTDVERVVVSLAVWWRPSTWGQERIEERELKTGRLVGAARMLMAPPKAMSQRTVDNMRALYWVCVYRDEPASPYGWVFSQIEPWPVPNQSMRWRRPTFQECMDRQAAFERDPDKFLREAAKESEGNRQYVRRAEWEAKRRAG